MLLMLCLLFMQQAPLEALAELTDPQETGEAITAESPQRKGR